MLKQLIVHRRALHRIPELDDQLPKTQAYLLSQLEGLRCRIITPGRSAVLAYFLMWETGYRRFSQRHGCFAY